MKHRNPYKCTSGYLQTGTLASNDDSGEIQPNSAFHQGLHCLLR